MKPIKCLLLLAAVLALAAMNAAAMDDPNEEAIIEWIVATAIDNLQRNVPHNQNAQIFQLNELALQESHQNVLDRENRALRGLAKVADTAASRTDRRPDEYQAREDEFAEICHDQHHMGFMQCVSCCTIEGYNAGQTWAILIEQYMDYQGLCVCRRVGQLPPPPQHKVWDARRVLGGDVVNPPR
jgi:hypothetical protein